MGEVAYLPSILRAMAKNYAKGHRWDHLDSEAVTKAADRIADLEVELAHLKTDLHDAMMNQHERDELRAENAKLRAELERQAMPDGWKLVPDDLCFGMREAGKRVIQEAVAVMTDVTLDDLYAAMIAAAPSAPKCSTCRDVGVIGHSEICPDCAQTWEPAPKADDPVKVQLLEALEGMRDAFMVLLRTGHDRIIDMGGTCDPVSLMAEQSGDLRRARAAIAAARQEGGK